MRAKLMCYRFAELLAKRRSKRKFAPAALPFNGALPQSSN